MDVLSFEPKRSQMVIYCEGFCPFWPFSVCDIGFPLPPIYFFGSVHLNLRPNPIKQFKKCGEQKCPAFLVFHAAVVLLPCTQTIPNDISDPQSWRKYF